MIHKQTISPPSKLLWMAPCCMANRAMQPLRNEILGRAINLYIAELCWMFDLKKWRVGGEGSILEHPTVGLLSESTDFPR